MVVDTHQGDDSFEICKMMGGEELLKVMKEGNMGERKTATEIVEMETAATKRLDLTITQETVALMQIKAMALEEVIRHLAIGDMGKAFTGMQVYDWARSSMNG